MYFSLVYMEITSIYVYTYRHIPWRVCTRIKYRIIVYVQEHTDSQGASERYIVPLICSS